VTQKLVLKIQDGSGWDPQSSEGEGVQKRLDNSVADFYGKNGRYNELVFMGVILARKATFTYLGEPIRAHPVGIET
jgi:hypothetical protein